MANLLDQMEQGIVKVDTPMELVLQTLGAQENAFLPEIMMFEPERVMAAHLKGLASGAQVIRTCSTQANRFMLEPYSLHSRVNEINWKAARLARESAKGSKAIIGGSIGPMRVNAEKIPLDSKELRAAFQDQIGALLDGGCDIIFLENFDRLDELLLALDVFQYLDNCPVITSVVLGDDGTLKTGETLQKAFEKLKSAGADVFALSGKFNAGEALKEIKSLVVGEHDFLGVLPMQWTSPIDVKDEEWIAAGVRMIGL